MVIFITDVGRYWNFENPILERYANCVIIVCLNGKKVTDKYRCVVSPYDNEGDEKTDCSMLSNKYQALKSIREELRSMYSYHDDIVFLTDQEPQSLYPYLVLKDEEYNKMHLWCMSPWRFERRQRTQTYVELLHDIDKLTSIHYVDANEYLKLVDRRMSMLEVIDGCQKWLNSMLPGALYEIDKKLQWGKRYYFDLKTRRYISTDDSYAKVLKAKPLNKKTIDEFVPWQMFSTQGLLHVPTYPDKDNDTKVAVEQLHPRLDGKRVCEELKQMRERLAVENGIEFQTVDCPSTGPCAGTCERCDMEIRYLQEQLMKKKEEDRKYPYIEIKERNKSKIINSDEVVLMGVPQIYNTNRNVNTELKIPDYLK